MTEQPELPLFIRRQVTASPEESVLLMSYLAGRGWTKVSKLAQLMEWTERKVRAAAHESGGLIIGGQKGLILTKEASLEEVEMAISSLRHRVKEINARVLQIERVRHGQKERAA